jgi:hypothetical protein
MNCAQKSLIKQCSMKEKYSDTNNILPCNIVVTYELVVVIYHIIKTAY